MTFRSWRLAPVALLMGLAACQQSAPVPPESFYRIDLATPAGAGRKLAGIVEVAPLAADGIVGERAIIHTDTSGVLLKYSYHSWVEQPARMLHKGLIDFLRARGVADQVVAPELRLIPTHRVQGTLRRLEQVVRADGSAIAVVEMELALTRTRDPKPLILKTYHVEHPAADTSVLEATTAIRAAVSEIYAQFAADMGK